MTHELQLVSESVCFRGGVCSLCSLFEGVCVHGLVLSLVRPLPPLPRWRRCRKRSRWSESRRCRRNWTSRLLNWSKPRRRGKCSGSELEINTERLQNRTRTRTNYITCAMMSFKKTKYLLTKYLIALYLSIFYMNNYFMIDEKS